MSIQTFIRHAIPRIEVEAYERGCVAGMAMEKYAPQPDTALDVRRLAFAIAAAEGGDGWTPWSTETTNAEMIAAKYGGIDVHTHRPDCGFCNPSLLAPQPDTASRELREAAQAFVDVWGETESMESSHTFVRLRAALEETP